jgi:hemolysin D
MVRMLTTPRQTAPMPAHAARQVLEFYSPTAALGMTPLKRGARGTLWLIITLAGGCVAAASLIPVDRVVSAHGRIVAQRPATVIQPLETAIIRSVDVREGQLVRRGDLLARLDPTFATADASALEEQVASLQAEVERLQAEASGTNYAPAENNLNTLLQMATFRQHRAERGFKLENYVQKISSLRSQVQRAMGDLGVYDERLVVARSLESKRIDLERMQVGSQINRLAATDSRLEIERGLANARAQVTQAARDLQALEAERDGYEQQWQGQVSQQLSEQTRKLSDARQQLDKAQLRHRLVELRSTEDAIVLTVARVSVGSVLQSGDELVKLVPTDAVLEAEADIAGTDAGFVRTGNQVTIKFDTFPFTQYGVASGTVRVVSADSFASDPDQHRRGPQATTPDTGQRFFRTNILLDDVKLYGVPDSFRVTPGMPVTADIKVGERTVMGYLLGRVLPVAREGMREP